MWPTKESGFNKAKEVHDRYVALLIKGATLFQGRVIANLAHLQPAKDFLKEINKAKKVCTTIGECAHTAAVAKNISDFIQQEIEGEEPTVEPTAEKERATGYLNTAFVAAVHTCKHWQQ